MNNPLDKELLTTILTQRALKKLLPSIERLVKTMTDKRDFRTQLTALQPAIAAVNQLLIALRPLFGLETNIFTLEVGGKIVPVFERALDRMGVSRSAHLSNYQWGIIALIGCNTIVAGDRQLSSSAVRDHFGVSDLRDNIIWFRQERETALQELVQGNLRPELLKLKDYLHFQERWKQGSMRTCVLGVLGRQLLCMGNFPD